MIIDIFSYNGEADILEIRLNILSGVVDQFIICESTTTFSGLPKELFFKKQQKRFKKWNKKIKYYVIDDYPNDQEILALADSSPSVPKGQEHWRREFYQQESRKKALFHLDDDDICFIGDVDEIWYPKIIHSGIIFPIKMKMYMYAYYLNNRSSEEWHGTFCSKYKYVKSRCINYMRTNPDYLQTRECGWHFTNMGGENEIRRKIESYGHQEFNVPIIKDGLKNRMETNTDYIGRPFKMWTDESDWPDYLKENSEKWKHLCR